MKSINKTITATAIMSSLLSFGIQAALQLPWNGYSGSEGDMTFKGEVADVTCEVTVNGDDSGETLVVLPDIYASTFRSTPGGTMAGHVLGTTDMVFLLTGCSGTDLSSKKAQVFFDHTENVESYDGTRLYYKNLSSTNAAGDVGFILSYNSDMFNPGALSGAPDINVAEGESITYQVSYYALSENVTAGQVTSQATYTMQYK